MQQLTILGSTGSIGVSTLDVVRLQNKRFSVYALTARRSVDIMAAQCLEFQPRYAVLIEPQAAAQLGAELAQHDCDTEVLCGLEGLCQVAAASEVDMVMAAVVGAAGLEPTLAAAAAGKKVLLANKESLVMAGQLFMDTVARSGALLLPIDSEHNALFQCLPVDDNARPAHHGVRKILLTASGGPFREWTVEQMAAATPDQACAHPNWSMGRKISVDSASLMNKGLELIEACWLFDIAHDKIEVVVHPQSIVHSMVQFDDGSVLAQLGNPDMRTPIAYGMSWPERMESGVADLDLVAIAQLDFEAPDLRRFPCLRLAREAVAEGGTMMAALNAANEVAVEAFLRGNLGFMRIPWVLQQVMSDATRAEPESLDVVKQADNEARTLATQIIEKS